MTVDTGAARAGRHPHPHARGGNLTEGPITATLLSFSLPILAGNVLQSLNGSINAIWVGRLLGERALAATSNAGLIMFLLLGVVFGVGAAANVMIGQAVGARDLPRARRVLGGAVGFFVAASLIVSVAGFLATPTLLAAMATPRDVVPLAEDYLRMVFVAMPFVMLTTFLGMALRGFGDSRTPLYFMVLAAVCDVTLNPLLILGVGPLPRLGIAGSAGAMLVAQAIALVAMIAFIYARKPGIRLLGPELAHLRPAPALLRTMMLKGLPMGAQMLVISVAGLVMIRMINAYGAATVAAYGVAMQLWTYIQMPAMAIGIAASAMAAQNVGAQRWDRVEQTARAGVAINFLLTGALVLASYALDHMVLRAFLPGGSQAAAIAERINGPVAWSFIPFGVMFVLFGVVRATGAVTPPLVILAISLLGVRLAFAATLQPVMGEAALWWSFPASMLVACAMAIAYYRYGGWRRARIDPGPSPEPERQSA